MKMCVTLINIIQQSQTKAQEYDEASKRNCAAGWKSCLAIVSIIRE